MTSPHRKNRASKREHLKGVEDRPAGAIPQKSRKLLNLQEESHHMIGSDRLAAQEEIRRISESDPENRK